MEMEMDENGRKEKKIHFKIEIKAENDVAKCLLHVLITEIEE